MNSSGYPFPSSIVELGGGGAAQESKGVISLPFEDLDDIISLGAGVISATADNFLPLVKMHHSNVATGQYQVTAGKKFVSPGFYAVTGANNGRIMFGYGTAALASADTNTAPAGVIYYSGSSAVTTYPLRTGGTNVLGFVPCPLSFPAASFPWVRYGENTGSLGLWIVGKEVS